MRCSFGPAVALALGWLAVGAGDADAAWNNVFQTTCRGRANRSAYFAPAPAPACCPSVSYVQRCYYQSVTTYKRETYYDPITTYRTSYYWEPVTSYKYTTYYDPCTGCAQNVATPYTSYVQRSRCNAVQSYVQRCRMVPVTEMRKSYYLEPVVVNQNPCCDAPAVAGGVAPGGIDESGGTAPRGGINESAEPERIKPQNIPGSSSKKVEPLPAKPIRGDRVASRTNAGRLQGTVVRDDRITPKADAKVRFVNDKAGEYLVKADPTGRFGIELPAGEWSMYVGDTFHSTVAVKDADDRRVTVVSR